MLKSKVKIIALTLVLILLLVPAAIAQDDGEETEKLNLEEYNLDYLLEQEIEALKTVLKNLKETDVIDEDQLTTIIEDIEMSENEEDTEEENFGQRLTNSIEEFKNEKEDWTGEELANNIQNFIINNREDIVPEKAQNKIQEAKQKKKKLNKIKVEKWKLKKIRAMPKTRVMVVTKRRY